MKAHGRVFWILGIMQRFWYANDMLRERFVSDLPRQGRAAADLRVLHEQGAGAAKAAGACPDLLQGHGPPARLGPRVSSRSGVRWKPFWAAAGGRRRGRGPGCCRHRARALVPVAAVKPSWQPPDWLFGPAWTLIYALAALAGVPAWTDAHDRASRTRIIGAVRPQCAAERAAGASCSSASSALTGRWPRSGCSGSRSCC